MTQAKAPMPEVAPEDGGRISGAEAARPRQDCDRCEDWRTVIYPGNVISPCPECRPAEFAAWRADGHQVPDGAEPTA